MQQPVWHRALPPQTSFSSLSLSGEVAVGAGESGLIGYTVHKGKVLWRKPLAQFIPYREGGTVYVQDGGGTIAALSARTGSISWRSMNLCPADAFRASPAVLYASARRAYAVCGDRITRLRKSDGARVASAQPLRVDQYQTIRPAGTHALALAGFSSGAELNFSRTLVRADTLRTIGDPRSDTSFVGVVGTDAVLDDACCNGRPDVYDPATLVLESLETGRLISTVDLRPDPQLFPADKRPIGQGATTALIDGHLYLAVIPMLYDYGNPLMPARSPERVLDGLTQVPTFMGSLMFAQIRQKGGSILDELLDLRGGGMKLRWKHPQGVMAMPMYDAASPGVVSITEFYRGWRYTAFVRLTDGAEIDVDSACSRPFASDGRYLLVQCSSAPPLISRDVRMYAFPKDPMR